MRMSEKFKIEASGERSRWVDVHMRHRSEATAKRTGCPQAQQRLPKSKQSDIELVEISYIEERFYPITKILDFAAIWNRNVFFE